MIKKFVKFSLLCALTLSLALILAACGSADGSTSASKTNSSTTSTEETADSSSEQSEQAETAESIESSETDATASDSSDISEDNAEGPGEIYFSVSSYNFGVKSDVDEVIANIGDPVDTLVTSSCAYQGDDYSYFYDSFEFVANTDEDGINRITSITLDDDTVSTPQGVKIGMEIQEALNLMNMDYEVNGKVYTFTSGYAALRIQAGSDDCVKAIQYIINE